MEVVQEQPKSKEITVDQTKLMTVPDYAKHINKTRQRVWQMIQAKEIPFVNICGKDFVKIS